MPLHDGAGTCCSFENVKPAAHMAPMPGGIENACNAPGNADEAFANDE